MLGADGQALSGPRTLALMCGVPVPPAARVPEEAELSWLDMQSASRLFAGFCIVAACILAVQGAISHVWLPPDSAELPAR